MSTTQPIRDISHVRALTNYYLNLGQHRNHLLILFGLHTALRIGDLLTIRWRDVYDFGQKCPRKTLTIKEQKTGKSKTLALNAKIVKALKHSAATAKPHEFLFANPHTGKAITRTQARRIIQAAGEAINLPSGISCHSLRKTFGYHAWQNGISPAVIMEIYNHSNLNHTRRYLGVVQDDLDKVYMELGF
ncbi:MAG: tyrosine-type recombinase/integrase [Firmicutes bacterium]|nr:tyrosine-type recombinase/integrase [Bacillota bacterium]